MDSRVLILVLLVFFAGCSSEKKGESGMPDDDLLTSSTSIVVEDLIDFSDCGSIDNQGRRDYCYKKNAVDSMDARLCGSIMTEMFLTDCYETIVMKTVDSTQCPEFPAGRWRELCLKRHSVTDVTETSSSSSTVAIIKPYIIECETAGDCPGRETVLECGENRVYRRVYSYICSRGKCTRISKTRKYMECEDQQMCWEGECISQSAWLKKIKENKSKHKPQ